MHLRTSALLAVCLVAFSVSASDWPQWRGPDRTDVSKETGLLKNWPAEGPKRIWEAKGAGHGYASVAIAKGKVYTLGDAPSTAQDKEEYLSCFDDSTGKLVWQTKLGSAWNANYPGARSTPTVDDDRVYVLTPHDVLCCLGTRDGKLRWKKDFGAHKADGWGYSESVLVDGDKVVCTPGGPETTMVALNKNTGDLIWKASSPGDRGAGHASIVIAIIGSTRVYVQTTGSGALGVRAKDGKVLWTFPIDRTTAVIPTPIVRDDLVFISAGYGRGGALLRQIATGNEEVKIEKVYGLEKALNNRHGGVVLVGDYLYGDTDHEGNPFCAELLTGKVRWKARESGQPSGTGSAAISSADGRLYIRYQSGTMVLAEATPDRYKEISSFKIPGSGKQPSWSHPVIANGRLYLREQDHILCYTLKQ